MALQPARQTLSSSDSFAMKFVWPAVNAVLFVGITVLLWWRRWPDKTGMINVARFFLPMIGIGSTAYGIWNGLQFKKVQIDDEAVYVSDYMTEIRVPYSELGEVGVHWKPVSQSGKRPIVTIGFRNPTVFGKEIQFFAKMPWDFSNSLLHELRDRRDRATGTKISSEHVEE